MGLEAVLGLLRGEINQALITDGLSQAGQVINGWPTAPQLVEILGQSDDEWQISLYPFPGKNATRYVGERGGTYTVPVVNLKATIDPLTGRTLTFSGSVPTALNVHSFLSFNNFDAYVGAPSGSTPAQIAAATAAYVNAQSLKGTTASATGPSVTLHGDMWDVCNIGGQGTITSGETLRTSRLVQVSIWTTGGLQGTDPDGSLRLSMFDSISSQIGTALNHFLTLPDGSSAYVMYEGDKFEDDSQSSYSLYSAKIYYELEYALFRSTSAWQVGAIAATTTINGQSTSTTYVGG